MFFSVYLPIGIITAFLGFLIFLIFLPKNAKKDNSKNILFYADVKEEGYSLEDLNKAFNKEEILPNYLGSKKA